MIGDVQKMPAQFQMRTGFRPLHDIAVPPCPVEAEHRAEAFPLPDLPNLSEKRIKPVAGFRQHRRNGQAVVPETVRDFLRLVEKRPDGLAGSRDAGVPGAGDHAFGAGQRKQRQMRAVNEMLRHRPPDGRVEFALDRFQLPALGRAVKKIKKRLEHARAKRAFRGFVPRYRQPVAQGEQPVFEFAVEQVGVLLVPEADGPDCLLQLVRIDGFQQILADAQPDGLLRIPEFRKAGQNDPSRLRRDGRAPADGFDPVHLRHADVHDGDIGMMQPDEFQHFFAVRGFTRDVEGQVHFFDHADKAEPRQRFVIGDDNFQAVDARLAGIHSSATVPLSFELCSFNTARRSNSARRSRTLAMPTPSLTTAVSKPAPSSSIRI